MDWKYIHVISVMSKRNPPYVHIHKIFSFGWMHSKMFIGDGILLRISFCRYCIYLENRNKLAWLVCAICWNVWKERNGLCCNAYSIKTVRQVIILIGFLLGYWSGNLKAGVVTHLPKWRPSDLNHEMETTSYLSPQGINWLVTSIITKKKNDALWVSKKYN